MALMLPTPFSCFNSSADRYRVLEPGRRDTFDLPTIDLQTLMACTDTVGLTDHLAEYESRESSDGSGIDFSGSFLFSPSPETLAATSVPNLSSPAEGPQLPAAAAAQDCSASAAHAAGEEQLMLQKKQQRRRAEPEVSSALKRARNAEAQKKVRQRQRNAEDAIAAQIAEQEQRNAEASAALCKVEVERESVRARVAFARDLLRRARDHNDFSLLEGLPELPAAPTGFNPQDAGARLLPPLPGQGAASPAFALPVLAELQYGVQRRALIHQISNQRLPLASHVAEAALLPLQRREADPAGVAADAPDDVAYRLAASALSQFQGNFEHALLHLASLAGGAVRAA